MPNQTKLVFKILRLLFKLKQNFQDLDIMGKWNFYICIRKAIQIHHKLSVSPLCLIFKGMP